MGVFQDQYKELNISGLLHRSSMIFGSISKHYDDISVHHDTRNALFTKL